MTRNPRQMEREILRVICQGCSDGALGAPHLRKLEGYAWTEPEHEALFRALKSLSAVSGVVALRELLPTRLTRLGFPDIVWKDLFQPHGLTRTEAERLVSEIVDTQT